MESYLMMLYVTLEQESALKNFFVKQGWVYCKPDMSVITDKLGPVTSKLSIAFEKVALTDTHSTEEQTLEATNQLQDEQQGSQTKNDIPETTAGVEKVNPRHKGKRKTKSLQQPATAAKQAKLVPSTSTDETVGLQGKHNVDNDTENKGEANKPIRIEMENRQQIHIKIEGENLDTIEREKVDDLIRNAGEESDNAAEDFEAADDDNEDDIGEESAIKIEYAENSSTCEVNLPEAHAAPKNLNIEDEVTKTAEGLKLPVPAVGAEVSQNEHVCQICGKTFSRRDNLKRHLRVHEEREDLQCRCCERVFTRKDNLIAHEKCSHSHSDSDESSGDPIICYKCGKQCKTKKALNDHMRTHTKKYVCDVCNARFPVRYKLERHIASHNQEKQQCPKCSKYFMQVKEHMERGKCTSDEEKPKFTCNSCNKSFKEKRYLNQLNKNIHNNTLYECQH